jgi:integrase
MARKKMGPPKNKYARRQPIPRELADELHRWMLTTPGDILFPGLKGGYLPNNSLNRWYSRLCKEAGIRRITSHGARHTAGSSYDQMGLGQRQIAELLGHRDLGATEQYTHSSKDAALAVIEKRWKKLSDKS